MKTSEESKEREGILNCEGWGGERKKKTFIPRVLSIEDELNMGFKVFRIQEKYEKSTSLLAVKSISTQYENKICFLQNVAVRMSPIKYSYS